MKKLLICSLLIAGIGLFEVQSTSAQARTGHGYADYRSYQAYQGYGYTRDIPPGQAKKIYGIRSARYFAHERHREKFYRHHRHGHYYDSYYRGYRYYPVPYPPVYPVPAVRPGVVINAHVWIP